MVALTSTIASRRSRAVVATCSSVLPPRLMPMARTRGSSSASSSAIRSAAHARWVNVAARVGRSPVPARVGDDQAIAPRQRVEVEDVLPVGAATGESVEQHERFARAARLDVELGASQLAACVPSFRSATRSWRVSFRRSIAAQPAAPTTVTTPIAIALIAAAFAGSVGFPSAGPKIAREFVPRQRARFLAGFFVWWAVVPAGRQTGTRVGWKPSASSRSAQATTASTKARTCGGTNSRSV